MTRRRAADAPVAADRPDARRIVQDLVLHLGAYAVVAGALFALMALRR